MFLNSTCLTAVTIMPNTLDRLPDVLRQDCETVCGEIREGAAVFSQGGPPPYNFIFDLTDHALHLHVSGPLLEQPLDVPIYMSPLKRIMQDYDMIIGAHGSALRHQAPGARIEAIDMGRRAMHNEGAEMVMQQLAPQLTMDLGTARLLYTLLFLLVQRR